MDELERLALEEEIDRLRHQLAAKEMQIVLLETSLEQAELAGAKMMMMLSAAVPSVPIDAGVDLTTPVDVH